VFITYPLLLKVFALSRTLRNFDFPDWKFGFSSIGAIPNRIAASDTVLKLLDSFKNGVIRGAGGAAQSIVVDRRHDVVIGLMMSVRPAIVVLASAIIPAMVVLASAIIPTTVVTSAVVASAVVALIPRIIAGAEIDWRTVIATVIRAAIIPSSDAHADLDPRLGRAGQAEHSDHRTD
jgi:hypothetical protein